MSGSAKKTRNGKTNNLRRISRDDVDRLSRGQPSKKKGYGSRNVPHRLSEVERAEMDRATKRGFLVLDRRWRKASPLANTHRQWCDARAKPQVIVYKAAGKCSGNVVDQVHVDLSPLRLGNLFDDPKLVSGFSVKWKADILNAANSAGLQRREGDEEEEEDNEDGDKEEVMLSMEDEEEVESAVVAFDNSHENQPAWATAPIWKLPVVSMGVFEGDRSKAKAMAKELALSWEIPEEAKGEADGPKTRRNAGARKGGRSKVKGISAHRRRRGGGHRQAW